MKTLQSAIPIPPMMQLLEKKQGHVKQEKLFLFVWKWEN